MFRTLLKRLQNDPRYQEWVQARNENRLFVFDYPYSMKPRPFETTVGGRRIAAMIDSAGESVREWLSAIQEFLPDLRKIPRLPGTDQETPIWHNLYLPGLDGMLLYTMVRKLNPKTYLEIGSGVSTKFVRLAIRDGSLRTRIVSIDPKPRAAIDRLADETIRRPLDSVDYSQWVNSLVPDDIVFVDCSHRSFPNSDVTVFFNEMLPALPAGVIYGIHDIFLPFDYPADFAGRFYNEQYLLSCYLLGGHAGDELLFPGFSVSIDPKFTDAVARLFAAEELAGVERHAGAFWMKRSNRSA